MVLNLVNEWVIIVFDEFSFLPCLPLPFLLGLLLDLILVGIIKLIFRRARPCPLNVTPPYPLTTTRFPPETPHASSSSLHREDHGGVKGEVLVAVWVWATVTAVSRILLGRHYVLDVAAAGAFLGVLEALFALRFLRLEHILL
ncbi:hypothetical protein YC2023_043087 [Brassica napus]